MTRRAKENEKLLKEIVEIHKENRLTCGALRVHAELRERGYFIGRNRARGLMRLNKI